jgi:hypothetical protein
MNRKLDKRSALLLALILAAAAQPIWSLGASLVATVVAQRGTLPMTSEGVAVLRDGTILIYTSITESHRYVKSGYRTLDNEPAADPAGENIVAGNLLYPPRDARSPFTPLPWASRIDGYSIGIQVSGPEREFWYFIHDGLENGSGILVGYDVKSKRVIGYIGTKGFSQNPPAPEDRFAVRGDDFARHVGARYYKDGTPYYSQNSLTFEPRGDRAAPVRLTLPDRVVEIDIPRRLVSTIWQGENVWDVVPLQRLAKSLRSADVGHENRLIVRDDSRLHILAKDRRHDYSVEIPEALRRKIFSVLELADGGVLVGVDSLGRPQTTTLAWIPKTGPAKIVEVPLDNPVPDSPHWPTWALAIPSPTALAAVWGIYTEGRYQRGQADSWADALRAEWPRFWPTLLGTLVVSGALARWVRRRQRQFGQGNKNLWAAFVLFLGPAAAVAYLVHRPWPVRELCPACAAMAPRDRDACFHCGADFPAPPARSTDIRG